MVKEKTLYNYQECATEFAINNIDESHVLIAAAPNAGKTVIASFIMVNMIDNGKRVLCSVHGTNILKRQFYESVCDIVGLNNVSMYDISDLSLYDPSKQVQIMIYQNIKQMAECVELYGKFDYLIVDEAHKFYEGTDSMETIINDYVKGNHLLLTGSPSIFKNRITNGEIKAKYISASLIESLHNGQYDSDIVLDIVSNDVHLTLEDYNQSGEVITKSEKKLTNNKAVLESILVGDFGKTIIYVKRISQANDIEKYLNSKGIINFTSHSETDKDSSNINIFKNEYSGVDNVVLIVVARATEGFDDPNVSIIDMTYTKNIDTLYQRYSRAIRKRTNAKNKRYVKVVPNNGNSAEVFVHVMTAVLMLLKQEHYENFNGSNFSVPTFKPDNIKKPNSGVGSVKSYCAKKSHETCDISDNDIIIKSKDKPVSVKDLVNNDDFNVSLKIGNKTYEITSDNYGEWVDELKGSEYTISIKKSNDKVDDCLLMETSLYSGAFFDTKDELYGLITRYATSSLRDVLKGIDGSLSPEETFQVCVDNKLINGGLYKKYRNEHPEINLVTKPYRAYKGADSESEFYKLIKEALGINNKFISPEETFNLCVDNRLTSSPKYAKYRSEHPELNLHSLPYKNYGDITTSREYFSLVKEALEINNEFISPEETFNLCVDNRLTSGTKYAKYRNEHPELNLYSKPYRIYNGVNTEGEYYGLIRETIEKNVKSKIAHREAYLSEFSEMNKRWNTSNSKTTHDRLKVDDSEWVKYHELYSNARKSWTEIPYQVIANKLKDRPEWVVGDFGCGENLLKTEIPNKVLSFDHVAIDETVTACDLINVPLEDTKLDVVVFSLSLMGTNYKEYFKEAYRILKPMGMVIISEPSTRWEDREYILIELLEEVGFNISGKIKHSDKFIYVTAIKY